MDIHIHKVATDTLTPYAGNTRTHSEEQVEQIVGSIKEFGFVNPILVGKDNVVIAGHGRLLAAQQMGLMKVPVIRLEHLTEIQRKALAIADNRIQMNAGWDQEVLQGELQALETEDFDLNILGMRTHELDDLLNPIALEEESGEEEEAEENTQAEEDKWKRVNILHGDCLPLMAEMKERSVDLVITSPPYAQMRQSCYGGIPAEQYVEWFLPRSEQILRVLKFRVVHFEH